jgi:8-oxo-dGTP pyrophosphatase MutT (NUDIX family)
VGDSQTNESRLTRIASAVRAHAPTVAERDEPVWEAAVAMVLRERNGAVEMLFIKRAVHAGDPWSGQVGLPGGRRDDGEADLADTVVRETLEELGLDIHMHGELIGALDELRPRTPVLPPVIVRPYVAILRDTPPFVLSGEVAAHFWVPLTALFDPGNTRNTRVQTRGTFWMWRDAIHYDAHVIWGLTERILRTFEEVTR